MAGLQGRFAMKRPTSIASRLPIFRSAATLVLALASISAPSFAGTYENQEYGFSVEVPNDAAHCAHRAGAGHVTGVIVILDASDIDCEQMHGHPGIGINGMYNADFATDVVSDLQSLCGDGKGGLTAAPPDLAFKHSRSAACSIPHDGGWVTIYVATMAWSWSDPGDDPDMQAPLIEYHARLFTTAERLEADTERFRAILNTVRIFTPE